MSKLPQSAESHMSECGKRKNEFNCEELKELISGIKE
jgi:hypothetical protein